jgi:hypothetical protein
MTQTTPLGKLTYPVSTDAADLPLHLRSLAESIDNRTVLRFSSVSDLTTTVTTPVAGMVAWVNATGTMHYYTGTAWVAQGAWNAYTPTWTAATTAPAIGDGSLAGKYAIVGKVCHFTALVTFGASTTYGSGVYTFGLPATSGSLGGLVQFGGTAISAAGRAPVAGQTSATSSATSFTLWGPPTTTASTLSQIGNTGIMGSAFASGHFIRISGTYEVA